LLSTQGTVIVALLRLTFAPYGISSYVLGVTGLSLVDFLTGTCAYAVNCSMQIFIGCSLFKMGKAEGGEHQKNVQTTMLIAEIGLSVIITIVMGYYATRLVKEKLAEIEERREAHSED